MKMKIIHEDKLLKRRLAKYLGGVVLGCCLLLLIVGCAGQTKLPDVVVSSGIKTTSSDTTSAESTQPLVTENTTATTSTQAPLESSDHPITTEAPATTQAPIDTAPDPMFSFTYPDFFKELIAAQKLPAITASKPGEAGPTTYPNIGAAKPEILLIWPAETTKTYITTQAPKQEKAPADTTAPESEGEDVIAIPHFPLDVYASYHLENGEDVVLLYRYDLRFMDYLNISLSARHTSYEAYVNALQEALENRRGLMSVTVSESKTPLALQNEKRQALSSLLNAMPTAMPDAYPTDLPTERMMSADCLFVSENPFFADENVEEESVAEESAAEEGMSVSCRVVGFSSSETGKWYCFDLTFVLPQGYMTFDEALAALQSKTLSALDFVMLDGKVVSVDSFYKAEPMA